VPLRILGIPDSYAQFVGPYAEHLRRYGIDAAGIAATARQALAAREGR